MEIAQIVLEYIRLCSDNVWKYNPNTLLSQDFEYIPIV